MNISSKHMIWTYLLNTSYEHIGGRKVGPAFRRVLQQRGREGKQGPNIHSQEQNNGRMEPVFVGWQRNASQPHHIIGKQAKTHTTSTHTHPLRFPLPENDERNFSNYPRIINETRIYIGPGNEPYEKQSNESRVCYVPVGWILPNNY